MLTHDEVVELAGNRTTIGLARENIGLRKELDAARDSLAKATHYIDHWKQQSHRLKAECDDLRATIQRLLENREGE